MNNLTETTNWAIELDKEREAVGDDSPVVACTLDAAGMNRVFDPGYGCAQGDPFTAWSERRVYFPVQYDGSEWVDSVPRAPCDEATRHVGGG